VHRLDLDTSGLLLAAKDADTHAALQRQFLDRQVDKRYVAWVEGAVAGEAGVIDLPLRVDLDDRPRQIHDPIHGKPAITEWRVIARRRHRTRVAFTPRTGRTHQLRVHAAHAVGLGAPIVGDRLYGRPDRRLLLHAEGLAFTHPHTGARVALACPAPF
jgi:tRNA pseudouridine32 synthase/23S rRNA pseudouridine746 synthase